MRGTKLNAWILPSIWEDLLDGSFRSPDKSTVSENQLIMVGAVRQVLNSIARDMKDGFLETVGVESDLCLDERRCSISLKLPEGIDRQLIARAIEAENVEAWCDTEGQVRVAVSPWFSNKDVDQAVLGALKVIHVILGMHAPVETRPKTLKQKLMASVFDVLQAQKSAEKIEK